MSDHPSSSDAPHAAEASTVTDASVATAVAAAAPQPGTTAAASAQAGATTAQTAGGNPNDATTPPPAQAAAPALFDEDGITITPSRIVVFGTPFPFKDAIGVRLFIDQRHKTIAVSVLVIGLLVSLYGVVISSSPAIALGVMLIVVSYLTWRFQTMRHRVYLVRASGDTEVLAVSNLPLARRVEQALDAALAANRSAGTHPTTPATP